MHPAVDRANNQHYRMSSRLVSSVCIFTDLDHQVVNKEVFRCSCLYDVVVVGLQNNP